MNLGKIGHLTILRHFFWTCPTALFSHKKKRGLARRRVLDNVDNVDNGLFAPSINLFFWRRFWRRLGWVAIRARDSFIIMWPSSRAEFNNSTTCFNQQSLVTRNAGRSSSVWRPIMEKANNGKVVKRDGRGTSSVFPAGRALFSFLPLPCFHSFSPHHWKQILGGSLSIRIHANIYCILPTIETNSHCRFHGPSLVLSAWSDVLTAPSSIMWATERSCFRIVTNGGATYFVYLAFSYSTVRMVYKGHLGHFCGGKETPIWTSLLCWGTRPRGIWIISYAGGQEADFQFSIQL